MTTVNLPALDGRTPLGFLAALGLLRVLADAGIEPLRMSFSRSDAAAELHSPLASIRDVVGVLQHVVSESREAAVVGLDPGFPYPASQKGGDPMRRPRQHFRELAAEISELDAAAAQDWLPCLMTDLAADSQGRADLTPFCAPSGKQNLRTFFEKPLSANRNDPSLLHDAVTAWRRVEGFTGEYFDHRAINSAADDPAGRSGAERGVPGATWLATMAIPLLRIAGDGRQVEAALWYRHGRRQVMIWPLWYEPLDLSAVKIIIEHPCLTPMTDKTSPTVSSKCWPALRIFAVYGADRQLIEKRKFAGVLAPTAIDIKSGRHEMRDT